MNRTTALATTVSLLLASLALGYVERPVSVSFFPPLSTNGMQAMEVRSSFSLNIVGGVIGAVDGVELGGVFNIGGEVHGFQGAGTFNITGKGFTGVQAAGVFNIVGESFNLVQAAGVFNVVGERMAGIQAAGVANITGSSLDGLQTAGAANVTGSDVDGAQVAGVANIAGRAVTGAQVSGVVNIAGEGFDGAQVGLVNIAERGSGVQLGLVNIAGEDDGLIPIGLVSVVEDGMFHLGAWTSDASLVTLGIKMGSRTVYNVFAAGLQPTSTGTRTMYGLGIGGRLDFNPFFVDIDAVGYSVSQDDIFDFHDMNLLNKLRLTGGWRIGDFLAVTAGPTVNVFVSDYETGEALGFYDVPLYKDETGTMVRIWPGFTAGVQLF